MSIGAPGGLHDQRRILGCRQARDILRDRPVKKRDPLRQIAKIPPQDIWIILVKRSPAQSDLAARLRPDTDQGAGECGFART